MDEETFPCMSLTEVTVRLVMFPKCDVVMHLSLLKLGWGTRAQLRNRDGAGSAAVKTHLLLGGGRGRPDWVGWSLWMPKWVSEVWELLLKRKCLMAMWGRDSIDPCHAGHFPWLVMFGLPSGLSRLLRTRCQNASSHCSEIKTSGGQRAEGGCWAALCRADPASAKNEPGSP